MALIRFSTRFAREDSCTYDGRQLRPHFIRERFGLPGNAAVAWLGPCDVSGEALVDLEDREQGHFIRARQMLHVMVELFGWELGRMVLLQRLLAGLCRERTRAALPDDTTERVRRQGDDVFVGRGKLTVSIATVSPVSGLIHLGVNVDAEGAPVETASLSCLGIPAEDFAAGLLTDLEAELDDWARAYTKVSPAHGDGKNAS